MHEMKATPLFRATMVEHVHQHLKADIWEGRLHPGQKLVIDHLAKRFGVSITPVREALRRLQLEGLVTDLPYRGTHVAGATLAELRELFTIRGVLEGFAIAQGLDRFSGEILDELKALIDTQLQPAADAGDVAAFRRLNLAFHERLLDVSAIGKLRTTVFDLMKNTERHRLLDIRLDRDYVAVSQDQHRRMLRLMREGRSLEVEELSRAHALMYVDHLASAGALR